jgi:hypothetical protein
MPVGIVRTLLLLLLVLATPAARGSRSGQRNAAPWRLKFRTSETGVMSTPRSSHRDGSTRYLPSGSPFKIRSPVES